MRLIELARQKAAIELNLTDQSLKKLPPELGQCIYVERLILSANDLKELPDDIFIRLVNIKHLSAFSNQLKSIPASINTLAKLQYLVLSNNKIVEIPQAFGSCTKLEFLDLSCNKLTFLRPNVGFLTSLKALHLADNLLEQLPPEIGKLIELETLVIRDNKISRLPDTIGELHKLRVFIAQGNRLEMLPPSIINCEQLAESNMQLKLAGNPLRQNIVAALQRGIASLFALIKTAEYQAVYEKWSAAQLLK